MSKKEKTEKKQPILKKSGWVPPWEKAQKDLQRSIAHSPAPRQSSIFAQGFDDDDAEIDYYGGYNYDFNEQIYHDGPNPADKNKQRKALELAQRLGAPQSIIDGMGEVYADEEKKTNKWWTNYDATKPWRGYSYFATPTLDYRYVEQMANMFSSKYNVEVRIGQTLGIDIEKKVLTYNPTQLMFGTKANLIASLLHEIGHLRYTTPRRLLRSNYLHKYGDNAFEVINIFEDFRVDARMRVSYEGAPDLFDSQMPKIREMAKNFKLVADKMIPLTMQILQESVATVVQAHTIKTPDGRIDTTVRDQILIQKFGTADQVEIAMKIRDLENSLKNRETLFDYCHAILLTGYGEQPVTLEGKLLERVEQTKLAIPKVVALDIHQEALAVIDADVFPVIEDLLKETKDGMKEVADAFGQETAREVMQVAMEFLMQNTKEGRQLAAGNPGKDVGSRSNNSGPSDNLIPEKWMNGDYAPLRESVASAIKDLIDRLTFLRRKEQTIRYELNHRRGKLNVKGLFRHRLRSPRLFKKKQDNTDTISSFAFSLMVDISGSMQGQNIVHTTRGVIILAEVFEKMGIPYEIQTFNNDYLTVKSFNDALDDTTKRRIAGMTQSTGGGTNMYMVFGRKDKDILARPEKNKYAIMLSDGGVGGDTSNYTTNFKKWEEKRLKVIGIGLGCGDEVVKLCLGNGFSSKEAAEMPGLFAGILKSLIKIK